MRQALDRISLELERQRRSSGRPGERAREVWALAGDVRDAAMERDLNPRPIMITQLKIFADYDGTGLRQLKGSQRFAQNFRQILDFQNGMAER